MATPPTSIVARPGYDPYAFAETGWFGEDLYDAGKSVVKGAVKAVSNPVNFGKSLTKTMGRLASLTPGGMAFNLARGQSVKTVINNAGKTVHEYGGKAYRAYQTVTPLTQAAMPYARSALASTGPWGSVAAGGMAAMEAGLQGKNLEEIALAGVKGALPLGIGTAIDFSRDTIRGKNPMRAALSAAATEFLPDSVEQLGFGAARQILQTGQATAQALGTARRMLPTEGSRRAFDVAVGTVAKTAERVGMSPMPRTSTPSATLLSRSATRGYARTTPRLFARPLPARAASFVASLAPRTPFSALFGRRDAAGIEGQQYRVEKGQGPYQIAVKVLGATEGGKRWRELIKANPQKPADPKTGGFKTLNPGELLNLPAGWVATPAAAATMSEDAILQARAILVAWSKSDGANDAGLTDYGMNVSDAAASWGPRDRLVLTSFSNWSNSKRRTSLPVSGDLTQPHIDELQRWAAARAAQAATEVVAATPAVLPPVTTVTTRPTVTSTPAVMTPTQIINAANSLGRQDPVIVATPAVIPAASAVPVATAPAVSSASTPEVWAWIQIMQGRYRVPADIAGMASAAIATRNPSTIRETANALRSKYPDLANGLDVFAASIASNQAAATATAKPAPKKDDGMGLIMGLGALAFNGMRLL